MNTVTMYTGINDTPIQRILSIVVLVLYQAKFNCLDLLILNLLSKLNVILYDLGIIVTEHLYVSCTYTIDSLFNIKELIST